MPDLRDTIKSLKNYQKLIEIEEELSTDLEIASLTNEVQRIGGPALMFRNPKGFSNPVLMNIFGTRELFEISIGKPMNEILNLFGQITDIFYEKPGLFKSLETFKKFKNIELDVKSNGPVKNFSGDINLNDIPILRTWPGDAGRYITFPVVITRDPETGKYNAGVYRMQVFDEETTGMHWQTQKTGMMHMLKAKKLKTKLDVAVAIGVHPSILFSSIAPLPENIYELNFSGLLMDESVQVVRGETVDLYYPSNAEIVLEGYVDPEELRDEGPFGDHTGYYTPVEKFPVFHIKKIFHRKDFIYHSTVVGKLWNEDVILGDIITEMFKPLIKLFFPEIVDVYLPEEGLFNFIAVVSINKTYPGQGRKVGLGILSLGQMMFTKYVIVVDSDVNIRDRKELIWAISTRTDPYRDIEIIKIGPSDTLDHASMFEDSGGKMLIDATKKYEKEGYSRHWPEKIEYTENENIINIMKKYGLTK
ncbi:MAG: UbiD family decarboxylase [Thermoplasmata archaeon]